MGRQLRCGGITADDRLGTAHVGAGGIGITWIREVTGTTLADGGMIGLHGCRRHLSEAGSAGIGLHLTQILPCSCAGRQGPAMPFTDVGGVEVDIARHVDISAHRHRVERLDAGGGKTGIAGDVKKPETEILGADCRPGADDLAGTIQIASDGQILSHGQ